MRARALEKFILDFVENFEPKEDICFRYYNQNDFCFTVANYSINDEERSWSILKQERNTIMPIEDLLSISNKLLQKFAPSIDVPSAALSMDAEMLEGNEVIQNISSSSDNLVEVNEVTKEEIENWVKDDDVGEILPVARSEQSISNVEGACTISHKFILEILASMQHHYHRLQNLESVSHAFMAGITKLSEEDAAYFYNNVVKILNTLGE